MHHPKYQRHFHDPNELDLDKLALLDAIDSETAQAAGRTAALRAPRNRTISNGSYSGRSGRSAYGRPMGGGDSRTRSPGP